DAWRRHRGLRALLAHPVDRGDGGGLRPRSSDAARAASQAASPLCHGRGDYARLCRAPREQSLWRPGVVDGSGELARHTALFPQLREIPAVAPFFLFAAVPRLVSLWG